MSAACDASYAWPLRHNLLTGGPRISTPPVVVAMPSIPKEAPGKLPVVVAATPPSPVAPAQTPAAATAKPGPVPAAATNPVGPPAPTLAPAAAPAVAIGRFAVQLGRGPSEVGAKKMIADARTLLGPSADMLAATTDISRTSRGRRRYTALLGGFPTLDAATNACDALTKAAQECLVRSADERVAAGPRPAVAAAPPPPAAAQASTAAKPAPAPAASAPKTTPALAAAAVSSQPSPPAPAGRFAVQLGRGPSKAGANRTIADARTLLGAPADKLSAATNMTEISRGRHRYTALLGGFPTLAAATEACDTLAKAGQECLTLDAGKPAVTAAAR